MECLRVALLLLAVMPVLLGWNGVDAASSSDCPDQYVYTQQPPQEIFICNPYVTGELSLSCSVLGENITDIQWWFTPGFSEENVTQLTNSSKHALKRKLVTDGLEIQLTIHNLGNEDVGTYWCQATVSDMQGVQLLSTSESVQLEDKDFFESQFIDNACNFVVRNSAIRCASILVPEKVSTVPTTFPEPSTSSPVSHYPTSLPSTSTDPPNLTPPTPPKSFFDSSAGILYAVLGLVGFLAIVCILLSFVVVLLCRRRCVKEDTNSCSAKEEIGFDQFSNQSDLPLMYKRVGSTHVIHSDTHSRNLSGEYAEIGPALSRSQEHGYSQIGSPHVSLPPLPTEMDPETGRFPTPGYENPYDLPIFPPEQINTDVIASGSKEMEGTDSQSLRSRDYHMLEQMVPLNSTLPMTPHHTYHTLEDPLPPSSVSSDPNDRPDDVVQYEPPLQLSCDSAELGRLPTIPEHDLEDQRTVECGNSVKPSHPSDTVSPDLIMVTVKDCAGFSEASKDDGEYDRLVDPQHLYHILEHSPLAGRPRIHNFVPVGYSNLEAGHAVKRKANLLPHVHFTSPQTDVTNLSDSFSSESSLDDVESNMFDDPQYLTSPLGRTKFVKSACNTDKNEPTMPHKCTHGRPPLFVHQTETQSNVTLSKYSGDYERDPMYMRQLCSESGKSTPANKAGCKQPLQAMDDSLWCDDSGFSTYSSLSLQDRKKGSSLPNLTNHIYQSLEAETLEPVQPYEKLKKSRKETTV